MGFFKDKLNEIVYAFSTEDRYADYNSYNHHNQGTLNPLHRESRAEGIQLNDNNTFTEDDNNGPQHSTEGVSETILAWRHIETWTAENHSDLEASLADPCTRMDIKKAEEDLGIEFPPPVRASFRIHDGQEDLESLTGSNGLFFGLRLMDLSDVVKSTKSWRLVAERIELKEKTRQNQLARERLVSPAGSSSEIDLKSKSTVSLVEAGKGYGKLNGSNTEIDPDLERKISHSHQHPAKSNSGVPKQRSIPTGAVKLLYANPKWIPLITDDAGNNIGVDLDPDTNGVWGQVILFGREFDTKFVLAPNWGDFLLSFVQELENNNYIIIEEEDVFAGEGELSFFDRRANREVPYLQYLAHKVLAYWRAQQKDLPLNPKAPEDQKNPISHIVPKTQTDERVVSTDVTPNKEENRESNVERENDDTKPLPEVNEVSSDNEKKETTVTDDADKSKDDSDEKLVNDFKEVTI